MSILDWLRENYGIRTKGRVLLILLGGAVFVVALLYMAGTGQFR